jgi:hypothetical protein
MSAPAPVAHNAALRRLAALLVQIAKNPAPPKPTDAPRPAKKAG